MFRVLHVTCSYSSLILVLPLAQCLTSALLQRRKTESTLPPTKHKKVWEGANREMALCLLGRWVDEEYAGFGSRDVCLRIVDDICLYP